MRPSFVILAAALTTASLPAAAETSATLYKDPNCGCCTGHAEVLRQHGYAVTVVETDAIDRVKRMAGVPEPLQSCHTTMIEGYVVEGHVPMAAIDQLLAERPKVRGIALPGMPQGSPGMSGTKEEPFVTYSFGQTSAPQVFHRE